MLNTFFAYIKRVSGIALAGIISIIIIRTVVIDPGRVNGKSMEHTYLDQEQFLANHLLLLWRPPKRGEIVQFIDPQSKDTKLVIKRIIGMPGEQVKISRNAVTIIKADGTEFKLPEPYMDPGTLTQTASKNTETYPTIEEHSYFLLGDNREESTDSRVYGAIQRKYITGLVMRMPFSKQHDNPGNNQ